MNAQAFNQNPDVAEKDLRAELISRCNLTAEDVETIYSAMEPTDTFDSAALRLGLVTQEMIEDALAEARGLFAEDAAGPIQMALGKIRSDRNLVVRDGEPVSPGAQLSYALDPYDLRSERLRALRTELMLLTESTRHANIVPILSPGPGEGRSQLAAELAISFAQLGRRTLLIDADMRKPRQHILFDAANQYGLSRSISLAERPFFQPVTGLPAMHLLTAGPVPLNPLELLSDGRFEKLLSDWRKTYEFIVIDTPPVCQYADGLAVATLASRFLLVSRAQHTQYKSTRETLRRLENTQAKILGAVLNNF